jgi:hypothetical protein
MRPTGLPHQGFRCPTVGDQKVPSREPAVFVRSDLGLDLDHLWWRDRLGQGAGELIDLDERRFDSQAWQSALNK